MTTLDENVTETKDGPGSEKKTLIHWLSARTKLLLLSILAGSSLILVVLLSIITYFYVQRGYLFYPRNGALRDQDALFENPFPTLHHTANTNKHQGFSELELPVSDDSAQLLDVPAENELMSFGDNSDPGRDSFLRPTETLTFIAGPSRMFGETNFEESLGGIKGPTVDLAPNFDFNRISSETNQNDDFRSSENSWQSGRTEFSGVESSFSKDQERAKHTQGNEVILHEDETLPQRSEGTAVYSPYASATTQVNLPENVGSARQRVSQPAQGNEKTKFGNETHMKLYRVQGTGPIGAVCLDGSAPAYYHRPGVGNSAKLWIIHFNGGAWCFDQRACLERSKSSLGSTKNLPPSPPVVQGINSADPAVNPDFYDWNLVWVVYCDGASFTGNREKPLVVDGHVVYLRGRRVLNAILNDLLQKRDLKFAEAVILTGSSAGSMTAMFQADYIASKFPKTTPIRVLSDAGFFLDTAPLGGKNVGSMFKAIYDMQNSSGGLNQDCINQVGVEEGWQCFLPARAFKYIKTPMFILNSAYDFWALLYFLGIDCKFPKIYKHNNRKRSVNEDHSSRLGPVSRNLEEFRDSRSQLREANGSEMKPVGKDNSLGLDALSSMDIHAATMRRARDISGFEIFPFYRQSEEARNVMLDFNASVADTQTKKMQNDKNSSLESSRKIIRTTRNVSESSNLVHNTSISAEQGEPVKSNSTLGDALRKLMDELSGKPDSDTDNLSLLKESSRNTSNGDEALAYRPPLIYKASAVPLAVAELLVGEENGTRDTSYPLSQNSSSLDRVDHLTASKPAAALTQPIIEKNLISSPRRQLQEEIERKLKNQVVKLRKVTRAPAHRTSTSSPSYLSNLNLVQQGIRRTAHFSSHKQSPNHRSVSIAQEYLNILRSDPPECTDREISRAMTYRAAIIKATDAAVKVKKSARFIVSCIDHSLSLFDETWTSLYVDGQSIQQVFGDWFYERGTKSNYNFVDCPWPCNKSCP